MNFGELKARILALIGRAPNDVCYELVTADINQQMRLRIMEKEVTLTESAVIDLPDDFLKVVSIYKDVEPRTTLRPLDPYALQRSFRSSGIPQCYAIENDQMRLSPSPNGSEGIVLRYIASFSDLSADTDTNAVLTKYPSVYVYGTLAHHAALIRDNDSALTWYNAYDQAKMQAKADDNSYRFGAGSPVPVVNSVA